MTVTGAGVAARRAPCRWQAPPRTGTLARPATREVIDGRPRPAAAQHPQVHGRAGARTSTSSACSAPPWRRRPPATSSPGSSSSSATATCWTRSPRCTRTRAWLPKAPLAILVCGDRRLERWPQYWEQDCAAATENLLIAATQLGLGAVWLGVHPLEERADGMRALLGIPRAHHALRPRARRLAGRAQGAVRPLRPEPRAPRPLVTPRQFASPRARVRSASDP